MKKTIILAIGFVMAASFAFAQPISSSSNPSNYKHPKFHGTVMSKPNKVDYGFFYGYGLPDAANTIGLVLDINCARNNYRTRLTLEGLEEWYWVGASVQAQYLIPIVGGLYLYPSVGIRGEIHNTDFWRKSYCEKHDMIFDPEDSWGAGSWGIGGEFGGGLEYQFCPYVALFAEGKYTVMYNSNFRWMANAGLTFHFGKGHR